MWFTQSMDSTNRHLLSLIQSARLELEEAAGSTSGLTCQAIESADEYLIQALTLLGEGEVEELDF